MRVGGVAAAPGRPGPPTFVSTGSLPEPDLVQALVEQAHEAFRPVTRGAPSTVYPALADVPADLFGLAVVSTGGRAFVAGDAAAQFSVMSVAKPFTYALVCEELGATQAQRVVGSNATGRAFNSVAAVESATGGRTNPMVNAGAIATVGLIPGATVEARWAHVAEGLSRFAGHQLSVDEGLLRSARSSNHRNRALAHLLHSVGALAADPDETVDLYTRLSCLSVSATDLAVMGSVLADGGTNPLTGEHVVGLQTCRAVLSVMTTAGLYETSGDWLYAIGLPGKSGIGGGIVTVAPGKGALGTFSPPLDAAGNSVRGQLAAAHLSRALGLDLFASAPQLPTTDRRDHQ